MKTPILILSLLLLTSCTDFMTAARTPTFRHVTVQAPLAVTYAKAIETALSMGAVMVHEDRGAGSFTVQLHNAVSLRVIVQPSEQQSLVTVSGILLSNKMVFGTFTEVDDFVVALQKGTA